MAAVSGLITDYWDNLSNHLLVDHTQNWENLLTPYNYNLFFVFVLLFFKFHTQPHIRNCTWCVCIRPGEDQNSFFEYSKGSKWKLPIMWTRLIMSALLITRWYPRFVISGYLVIPGSMTECVMVVSATGGYWGKELTTPDMLTNNWTCSLLVNLRYAEDLSGNCSSTRAYYRWWELNETTIRVDFSSVDWLELLTNSCPVLSDRYLQS